MANPMAFLPIHKVDLTGIAPRAAIDCMRYIRPVGSRVTCDPAPMDTDCDYLVLTRSQKIHTILQKDGWTQDTGAPKNNNPRDYTNAVHFKSWRKGETNLIITDKGTFYDKFVLASRLAKQFNLLKKADRIALFQAVLYGNAS